MKIASMTHSNNDQESCALRRRAIASRSLSHKLHHSFNMQNIQQHKSMNLSLDITPTPLESHDYETPLSYDDIAPLLRSISPPLFGNHLFHADDISFDITPIPLECHNHETPLSYDDIAPLLRSTSPLFGNHLFHADDKSFDITPTPLESHDHETPLSYDDIAPLLRSTSPLFGNLLFHADDKSFDITPTPLKSHDHETLSYEDIAPLVLSTSSSFGKHMFHADDNKKPQKVKDTVPGMLDILCGKKEVVYSHVGNRRFRDIVSTNFERYQNCT
jgi:hypothetical protein